MSTRESPFSAIPAEHRTAGDALCFAVRDANPVSPGHSLVIPVREIATWFDATPEEWESALRVVATVKEELDVALDPDMATTSASTRERQQARPSFTHTST